MEIRDQVRAAVRTHVRQQVNKQIVRYIPIPFDKQIVEAKKRLSEARIALANSSVYLLQRVDPV